MTILTIARLTWREASRRRLIIAVVALTLLVAIFSGWAFHKLLSIPCGNNQPCSPTDQKILAATLLIMLAFMFSFILALGAAFLGAPSIAADIESGVLLSMLPRPIRRSDIILGKWLGLGTFIAAYAAIACGLEFIIAANAFNYVPPHPILTILFLILESLIVLTLALAASTRISGMTGGIVVTVLFGVTWIAGIAGEVGAVFHARTVENIGTVSSLLFPTDGMWRAAIYNLEPVAVILAGQEAGRRGAGNPFFVTAGPTAAYMMWVTFWVVGFLGLAVWSFRKREL